MIQTTPRDTNALCWNKANITNTQGCSPAGKIGDTSSPIVDIWPVWCTYRKNKPQLKASPPLETSWPGAWEELRGKQSGKIKEPPSQNWSPTGKKIIHHVLIYDPLGSTWLLIFVIPYMIGTSCCREFSYPEFSLCRSKKYSHGPRSSETATRTNEARGYNMVPYGGAQDWHGRTWSVSGKCHSQNLIEPRNQRAANEISTVQGPTKSKKFQKQRLELPQQWK